MTQLEIVNHHLATHGRITPLEAQSNYRIWRLAAVIHTLLVAVDSFWCFCFQGLTADYPRIYLILEGCPRKIII